MMTHGTDAIDTKLIPHNTHQFGVCTDPMLILSESVIAYVKQRVNVLELVTGCEQKNVYDVYSKDKNGNVTMLFTCKEESGCCERMYCRGDSRPFKMMVKHVTNPLVLDESMMNTFCVFDRPFKCTCYCLDRPKITGSYKSESGTKFGSITQPWTYCDPQFVIKDLNKEPQFVVHGDCCQCGLICGDSWGKCADVMFGIYPINCSNYEMKNSVGQIKKVSSGLLQELFTDSDNFEIMFPINSSPEEKLLMIGATLLIDYRFFEDTQDPNKKNFENRL